MAVTTDEVKKLAELARLEFSEAEIAGLRIEIDAILKYIDAIRTVSVSDSIAESPHMDLINVMREDTGPHEGGAYTEDLVTQFSRTEGNALKVKKILN